MKITEDRLNEIKSMDSKQKCSLWIPNHSLIKFDESDLNVVIGEIYETSENPRGTYITDENGVNIYLQNGDQRMDENRRYVYRDGWQRDIVNTHGEYIHREVV